MTSPGLDDSISQRTLLLQNLLRNGRGIGQNTSRKTAKLELRATISNIMPIGCTGGAGFGRLVATDIGSRGSGHASNYRTRSGAGKGISQWQIFTLSKSHLPLR